MKAGVENEGTCQVASPPAHRPSGKPLNYTGHMISVPRVLRVLRDNLHSCLSYRKAYIPYTLLMLEERSMAEHHIACLSRRW